MNTNKKGKNLIKTTAGTNRISKYFIKTTTQRLTASPNQVPDTDEVRHDITSHPIAAYLPFTGCTQSDAGDPTANEGTPHWAMECTLNNHPSNRDLMPFVDAKMPSEPLDDSACDDLLTHLGAFDGIHHGTEGARC